ncbi:uncharacterized protein KY384_001822 [Bacidia gigantensis]|uniref:uncharacterized protein n=1 Tax=Bacidia gigantensis TaxID=2732470 RepID=UPI001D03BAF3|nr:uncharacterized protein KY384_001822 [Bacidia gigantensis]KAG8533039.1 hypothetical protein KY384_001822 [Bacidia gigantensis]
MSYKLIFAHLTLLSTIFASPTPQGQSTEEEAKIIPVISGGLPSCPDHRPPGSIPDGTCYPSISVTDLTAPSAWGALSSLVDNATQALVPTALGGLNLSAWYQASCAQPISDVCNYAGRYDSQQGSNTPSWVWGIGDTNATQTCLVGYFQPVDNAVAYPSTDACQANILGPLLRVMQQTPTAVGRRVSVNLSRWPDLPDTGNLGNRVAAKVTGGDQGSGVNGSVSSWIIQPLVLARGLGR